MYIKHDSFDEQSAQEILKRAMEYQSQESSLSEPSRHISASELDAMATELGITPKHLLAARTAWLRERSQKTERKQRWSKQCWLLRNHALAFLGFNGVTMPYLYETDWYGYHSSALLFPFLWTIILLGHSGLVWCWKSASKSSPGNTHRIMS